MEISLSKVQVRYWAQIRQNDADPTGSGSKTMAYLLYEVDGGLEIQTEVDELPLDSLALVFLLLKDEHLHQEQIQLFTRTDGLAFQ